MVSTNSETEYEDAPGVSGIHFRQTVRRHASLRIKAPRGRRLVVFTAAMIVYVTFAWWAIVQHNLVMGDAISRLANATYSVTSRDPHLSAIGFVWNPLPTISMIPFVLLRGIFHVLAEPGFAASLSSCVARSMAVVSMDGIAREWCRTRWMQYVVLLGFALNPMILLYAANGMSEAFLLAFVLATVRPFNRWLRDPTDTLALVTTGVLLAAAYLVRYESLAATAAVAAVVTWKTWNLAEDGRKRVDIIGNLFVVAVPSVVSFGGFAVASWVVTGSAAEQFTSNYGNTSIVSTTVKETMITRLAFSFRCLEFLAPLLGLLMAIAILRLKDGYERILAVTATIGAVSGAALLLHTAGSTLPFLRFFISAIPFEILLALAVIDSGKDKKRRRHRKSAAFAMAGVILVGTASTVAGMLRSDPGTQEHQIASILDPRRDNPGERAVLRTFQTEQRIAAYLDNMHLPKGAVLVDVLAGFPIVESSRNPKQFVIPSDRDFALVLSNPAAANVQYLLTVDPNGRGGFDALNRRFPSIYDSGADQGELALEAINDGAGPNWRLYRLPITE